MAYLNLILTAIILVIWVMLLTYIIKLEQSRTESLNIVNEIITEVRSIKEDFKKLKSFINKY